MPAREGQPAVSARAAQLGYVQRLVAQGDYRVDAKRVAAAMLQRIGATVLDREINGELDRARRLAADGRREA